MSPAGTAGGDRSQDLGAKTAGKGTPVPADTSASPRARGTMALFVAGPVIWTVHFLVVYLVVEAGCTGGGPGLQRLRPPVPTVVTLAATAIAVVACLACAGWGYQRWRGDQQQADDGAIPDQRDRGGSLALIGAGLSLLGVIVVLFVGLPAVVLPAC